MAALSAVHREKAARRSASQRSALYEVQDAALELRRALQAYGRSLPGPSQKVTRRYDEAHGRVQVVQYRLLCDVVRQRVQGWSVIADRFWTGDEAVSATDEATAWNGVQIAVGEELRRYV